jgi:hypothetical protein
MNRTFNLILTLALWLVAAQTAWADDVTWYMHGGEGTTCNKSGNQAEIISSDGETMLFTWTDGGTFYYYDSWSTFFKVIDHHLSVTFPYISGTVTEVKLSGFDFMDAGMKFSVGNGTTNLTTSGNQYFFSSDTAEEVTVSFTGSIDVDTDHPLRFTFSQTGPLEYSQIFNFRQNSYIKVTYTPAASIDHGHSFNITTSGNVLTATCTNNEQSHQCITNHQATLTLVANDGMAHPVDRVSASLDPTLGAFNNTTELGATCTFEYTPQGSSNWTTTAPNTEGNYTVRAAVAIGGANYVLTSNFRVLAGYYITNNYPQQLSINKTGGAMAGENVTVTFTPQMGESLTALTVTGDNTSLSIDNGISDNGGNTYTFAMPNENVTLGGTFTFPTNANFTQNNNTYTIKNADGWDYFCQLMRYDASLDGFSGKTVELAANISVTTMAGIVHPFKGTFDGKGKTLTFNPTEVGMYTAPFQNTDGATICNLHVTGLIEGGNWNYMGGLVGSASGNLTIENCRVSTQISSTFDSNTLSANVGIGGFVGLLSSQYNQCHITGCVFDGLIYNPNYSGTTYGCGGFVGCFSQYGYAILEDCLFIEGQYDNNGGKHELLWGNENDMNSTFLRRTNNQGEGTLTNCFFVATHFLKQGSPAVESATAPDNFAHFGDPTTDHGFLKVYGHTMVFDGKYYTPTYGDLVETYSYSGDKSYIIEYDDMPLGIKDVKTKQSTKYLRYNRPFTKDKAVTIMLPFDFRKNDIRRGEYDNISEGKFYEFAGIEEVPINMWTAVMKEVGEEGSNEETTMKANTPYLFMPGENAKYLYFTNGDDYYQGFDIFTEGYERGNKQTEYDGSDGTYSWNKWNFKGTYQPRYWSDSENPEEIGKVYGFAGATKEVDEKLVVAGDFVRAKSGAKIRPTSCYLMWAGSEPDNARALTRSAAATEEELPQSITVKLVGANGETTAIGTLDTKTGEMTFDSEAWYTLDGVRLSGKPSSKGIYINNGKKVVIK